MSLDRERLLAIFAEELEDRRRELERGLLELAQEPSPDRRGEVLRELLRSAHSLKGAAHSVGATQVASIAHDLEDAFDQLGDDPSAAEVPGLERLLAAVDRLGLGDVGVPGGPAAAGDEKRDIDDNTPESDDDTTEPGAAVRGGPAVGPLRTRVSVADLEATIARASELRLAVQQADGVIQDMTGAMSQIRQLHEGWQGLRVALGLHGRGDELRPAVRAATDRFDRTVERLASLSRALEPQLPEVDRQLKRSTAAVSKAAQQLGMVRFDEVCAGLDRAVRDIATTTGKRARLEVASGDLEIDRSVATAVREPLLHLVRNAVDHGIEPPEVRAAAGKSEAGRVQVEVELRQGESVIVVSDDGAGIDRDAVRGYAQRHGMQVPDGDDDVVRAVFTPGLSTTSDVSAVSGRGVGLDVVRTGVESVGGTVRLTSTPGDGTRITLSLPLTLSTMRAVLVDVGGETVAVPVTAVERVLRVAREDVIRVDGRDTLTVDDRSVVLAAPARGLAFESATDGSGKIQALVVSSTQGTVAFPVEATWGERDVTVRTLGPRLREAPGVLGGMILADGTCGFLLHAATWVKRALQGTTGATSSVWREEPAGQPHVLLAEDTLTTRALERSILEAAGYQVTVAADGAEAWRTLQRHGADVVVTDVDMPQLDGFELCERIRSSTRFAELPVVLVTSLADERDRAKGLEAGASAYFVKSALDQDALIDTIARLL